MPTGVPSTRAIAKVFFVVAGLALALVLLYEVRTVLVLVFIAIFLAIALGPAVDLFVRWRVPRALAILLVYVLIALVVFLIALLIVPPVAQQISALSRDLPRYIDDLSKSTAFRRYDAQYDITSKLQEQAAKLPSRIGDAASTLQSVTVGLLNATVQLVTVLTMTFFLLLDGKRAADFTLALFGPREPRVRLLATEVYRSVSGYVAGNFIISVIAGLVTYVTLEILGVPFTVPLSVLMAFLDLIPLVGATIGGITIGLVTVFNDFPTATIVWAVVFIVYQQVENNVIQPVVYRRTVNVPPLAVIVAILIGSSLLGVLGALVAIPVAAAVQIVAKDVWRRRAGEPALTHGDPLDPQLAPEPEPEPARR